MVAHAASRACARPLEQVCRCWDAEPCQHAARFGCRIDEVSIVMRNNAVGRRHGSQQALVVCLPQAQTKRERRHAALAERVRNFKRVAHADDDLQAGDELPPEWHGQRSARVFPAPEGLGIELLDQQARALAQGLQFRKLFPSFRHGRRHVPAATKMRQNVVVDLANLGMFPITIQVIGCRVGEQSVGAKVRPAVMQKLPNQRRARAMHACNTNGDASWRLSCLHARERVSQFPQNIANLGLNQRKILWRHILPPRRHALRLGRFAGHSVNGKPLLANIHCAVIRSDRPLQLFQPPGSPFVVVQHRRMPFQAKKLADSPQGWLGLQHQVLVAHLKVMLQLGCLPARGANPPRPQPRSLLDRAIGSPDRMKRHRGIAAIADQVNKVCFGQQCLNLFSAQAVWRRFIAIALLAESCGIGLVEYAQPIAKRKRLKRHDRLAQARSVDLEIGPALMLR